MEVTSWNLHQGKYLVELKPWKLPSGTYTVDFTSWNLQQGSYFMEFTPWKLPHGTYTKEIA